MTPVRESFISSDENRASGAPHSNVSTRHGGRSRARMVALGLLVPTMLVLVPGARTAEAFIGNVIPANELEEPTDTFTTANALFAFVTTDPRGGRVCVVPETTVNPGDGSLSCDGAASWATPNFVSGIGTVIVPIKGPYLRVGTLRLLADSSQGAADALSIPFHVRACTDCDTTLAQSILDEWKAAARASARAMAKVRVKLSGVWPPHELDRRSGRRVHSHRP